MSWTDLDRDDREAATTAAPIEEEDNSPPAQARGHQRCHERHHHVLQRVAGQPNANKAPADPRPGEHHCSDMGYRLPGKRTTDDYLEE